MRVRHRRASNPRGPKHQRGPSRIRTAAAGVPTKRGMSCRTRILATQKVTSSASSAASRHHHSLPGCAARSLGPHVHRRSAGHAALRQQVRLRVQRPCQVLDASNRRPAASARMPPMRATGGMLPHAVAEELRAPPSNIQSQGCNPSGPTNVAGFARCADSRRNSCPEVQAGAQPRQPYQPTCCMRISTSSPLI